MRGSQSIPESALSFRNFYFEQVSSGIVQFPTSRGTDIIIIIIIIMLIIIIIIITTTIIIIIITIIILLLIIITTIRRRRRRRRRITTIILIIIITIIRIRIIIMTISIACYPQLQLGHNVLATRHDQNNKAPKVKRRTHTQKHP